uniref:Fe2OG dioxygenase domain-containing protein n=1 Tax=Paramoeba aestuarina TaxID=180227 RepID=A0A7S4KSA9_9EUKA|mmetsp:Transcript_24533/g.38253  ORF Transcript_24533/g.38253 Transcript_24533/m.38253 type:complete len:325 (+) Transcript_24533:189-1163(+)
MMLVKSLVFCLFLSVAFCELSVSGHIADPLEWQLKGFGSMLAEYGHVHIPNFLPTETREKFLEEIEATGVNPVLQRTTIYQDHGDFENFTAEHPRNFRMQRSLFFASRSRFEKTLCNNDLSDEHLKSCSTVLSLYSSPVVFNFFSKIVEKSRISRDIYVSNDHLGSVYALKIPPGGVPEKTWHFDEHSFSCVLMLQKPATGGDFRHARFPTAWNHFTDPSWSAWDSINDLLQKTNEEVILEGEDQQEERGLQPPVYEVNAQEGDAYCFFGDEELHDITQVGGERDRIVVVFAYTGNKHFVHSGNVHENNDWDNNKKASPSDCEA